MIPKFRAWDKVSETMHKVEGIRFGINGARVISLEEMNRYNNNHTRWHTDVELLQSTGLFDIDGNEIYIGDILKVEDEYTQVVFHEDNTTYGVYLEDKEGGGNPISDYSTRISLNHIKGTIEGNKYEHPHLLRSDGE